MKRERERGWWGGGEEGVDRARKGRAVDNESKGRKT